MGRKEKYLAILFLFFVFQIIAPSKIFLFLSYIIILFLFNIFGFSYLRSVVFVLLLSIFSEFGLGGSLFIIGPKELDLGSAWWFSPFTLMLSITFLMLVFGKGRGEAKTNTTTADFYIFGFFVLCVVNFFYYPYFEVFLGLLKISEAVLLYFFVRMILKEKDINYVVYIFAGIIIFQSLLSILQYQQGRPLGKVIETVNVNTPYGITAVEQEDIIRSTGAFGHPNILVVMILGILPFVLFKDGLVWNIVFLFGIGGVFLSYSRVGWVFVPILFINKLKDLFSKRILILSENTTRFLIFLIFSCMLFIIVFPQVESRLNTVFQAFDDTGSMGIRFALYKEASVLIKDNMLFGAGINRSVMEYTKNPLTEQFRNIKLSGFYRIHNMFVEIAAEVGLPAVLLFIFFILSSIMAVLKYDGLGLKGQILLAAGALVWLSLFNPFFHMIPFRLLMFLLALANYRKP